MEKDIQKSIYTLLALFGLLIALIVIFMQTGDITPTLSFSAAAETAIPPSVSLPSQTKKDSIHHSAAVPVVVNQYASQVTNQVAGSPAEQAELEQYDIQEPTSQILNGSKISGCALEEGTYKATVTSTDLKSGRSGTYKLDVIVLNCQIIAIDFRKGEWLDHDHFRAADIDENGNASVEDDRGRLFDIHISK